jgi:hypothetical protein
MYREAVKTILMATAVLVLLDLVVVRLLLRHRTPAIGSRRLSPGSRATRVAVNLFGVVSLAALVWTGFYPLLTDGRTLTGYRLMAHVGAAPPFAVAAVLVAVFWAHRNRLTGADWNRLRRPVGAADPATANPYAVLFRKLLFWIALGLAVPAALSTTLAMFPMFSPVRQEDLLLIHRVSVLPLAAAGALCAYFSVVNWIAGYAD